MRCTYDKEVRERAKDMHGMAFIDIHPHHGTRITTCGPCTKRDLEELREFWIAWEKRKNRRWRDRQRKRRNGR